MLVDKDEIARISDFGLAVYINGHSANYASLRAGNIQWQAPELLRPPNGQATARPTPASDVYSFSHVCIEVCFTRAIIIYGGIDCVPLKLYSSGPPYPEDGLATGRFIDDVTKPSNAKRPVRPASMPDVLWELLQRYWHTNPADRPPATTIVREVAVLEQVAPA